MARPCEWNKAGYSHENPIKFLTRSVELSLCDYSDACILATEILLLQELLLLLRLLPNPEESKQVSVDSFKTYLLPRIKIENYNIEIDGRNFYNQPINGSIKQYDEVKIFKLTADDLSK